MSLTSTKEEETKLKLRFLMLFVDVPMNCIFLWRIALSTFGYPCLHINFIFVNVPRICLGTGREREREAFSMGGSWDWGEKVIDGLWKVRGAIQLGTKFRREEGTNRELGMESRCSTWVEESEFKTVNLYSRYRFASSKRLIFDCFVFGAGCSRTSVTRRVSRGDGLSLCLFCKSSQDILMHRHVWESI